jgi:hypothetical protein
MLRVPVFLTPCVPQKVVVPVRHIGNFVPVTGTSKLGVQVFLMLRLGLVWFSQRKKPNYLTLALNPKPKP